MFSALILVVPLVLPLAQAYEIHPIHLGIIFLTNLEIGVLYSSHWTEPIHCKSSL